LRGIKIAFFRFAKQYYRLRNMDASEMGRK
jgi:hypothetical protein